MIFSRVTDDVALHAVAWGGRGIQLGYEHRDIASFFEVLTQVARLEPGRT